MPLCREHQIPFVPVLQLLKSFVPELPMPAGCDVFQLLWCPREHQEDSFLPKLMACWRKLGDIKGGATLEPKYDDDAMGFEVNECVLTREEVVEYPYLHSLSSEESDQIEAWEDGHPLQQSLEVEPLYQYLLSTCPGTKVGGYPDFGGQDDFSPKEDHWQYLLTLADGEWDGGSKARWMPEGASWAEGHHVGTYLKESVNLFFDARNPDDWKVVGAR
ncbi:MAG: hypothetical protein JRH20_15865 [Deltaproteobacteria bacterium]|nr:hypothetical protein [Deltaproteobacteria bacterium]